MTLSGSVFHLLRVLAGAIVLVIVGMSLEFAVSDWHGKEAYGPLIHRQQAEQTAVATISQSQHGTTHWIVVDTIFHNESTTVTDRGGGRRFGSSWTPCPLVFVGSVLNRLGIACPPPPVWTVEVTTLSRPTDRKALVEIDAVSGDAISWLVDDSLP